MKKKNRGDGNLEVDDHGVGVARLGPRHRLLHVDAPAHLGAEIAQRVERIGDVFGAERLAVAPADAGTGLDRQPLEIGRELIALGEPHLGLVGEGAVIGERLIDQVRAVLVVGADRVRVPQLVVRVFALNAAVQVHQRPVARDGLETAELRRAYGAGWLGCRGLVRPL